MCAMLALVAPEELKLDLGRAIQFVEAYIGEQVESSHPITFLSHRLY